MPRFSIHSWNDDGTVNEPWMHEEVTAHVRDLIKFRARLQPYLYDLMWRYHNDFEPIVRPTFYEFPRDERCLEENDELMLGPSLLVAAVVEPGATRRSVYLPAGADWYHYWSRAFVSGGQTVTVPAEWGRPPLFVRAGSVLPVNLAEQHFGKPADERGFEVFPLPDDRGFEGEFFEDDGISFGYRRDECARWSVHATGSGLRITVLRDALFSVPARVNLVFPGTEQRAIVCEDGRQVSDVIVDGRRWVTLELRRRSP
jgi:alpha-glucosidase